MRDGEYAFDRLPLDPVRAGTTILVAGPSHAGTKQLAFRMLAGDDEGVIILTTNTTAADVAADCAAVGITPSPAGWASSTAPTATTAASPRE